ncbi:MAG: pyruvate kinase [Clostridiales bacterium]|nr:pyruvate kinase [Clostridiales bacterium]
MLDFFGTIGPVSSSVETLVALINEGMTGVRINNSHSRLVDCEKYLDAIKSAESQTQKKQKILIDLQGAELRIGNLTPFQLRANDIVRVVCEKANAVNQIPVPKALYDALKQKPTQLLLDDGLFKLNPAKIYFDYLEYQAESDCVIRPNKSIASDLEVNLPVLSDADIKDIEYAVELGGIYGIMIPFVQKAEDLIFVKEVLQAKNATQLKIYAKIENQSGVDNIKEIIPHCDVVVIARGDLGANIPLIKIP